MSDKKANIDIALDAVMQLVPYVGPSISALYFGHKQEKRFKRLELFYSELKDDIELIGMRLPNISTHDPDSLASILEALHDKIESEHLELKRTLYRTYYINTLLQPVNDYNYDQRMTFLNVLDRLTQTQISLLAFINAQKTPVIDKSIRVNGTSDALVQGSISQLKILGLVDSRLHGIVIGSNSAVNEEIQTSQFGKEFHDFCMK